MRTDYLAQAIILLVMVTAMIFAVGFPMSADLRAVWLAGAFYDAGTPGMIYAGSDGIFTMKPPLHWIEQVQAEGVETPVYPFIYPPLWAWVSAQVVSLTTFGDAVFVATGVNLLLLASMPYLAYRIARPGMSMTTFLLLSLPLFAFTNPFLIPLEENQPQILVSFLVLLAIERSRNGAPVAGGIAMALAASIKLYPAVFALLWLLGREKRAFTAFVIAGGSLGIASLLVAGWPMHAAFLNEIRAISSSALYSTANYSLDPFIAKLLLAEDMIRITTEETGGASIWKVVEKNTLWRAVNGVLFVGTLGLLAFLAWRGKASHAYFWPAAFLLLALVSPLTWLYHLIPALVFLPALLVSALPRLVSIGLYLSFIIMMRTTSTFAEFGLTLALPGTHELLFLTLLILTGAFLLQVSELVPRDRAERPST